LKQYRLDSNISLPKSALRCPHGKSFKHGEISGSVTASTAVYTRNFCKAIVKDMRAFALKKPPVCYDAVKTGAKLQETKGGSSSSKEAREVPVRAYQYRMEGHAQQCVDRYLELSGKDVSSLKMVATPCIDDGLIAPEDHTDVGNLGPVASRIVLKALYLARMNRPDIYWTVNHLARNVTTWSKACDKRLHRLMSYLYHHQKTAQVNWIGDKISDCKLMLFVDASFAGDYKDSKSTTGAMLCLVGPNTFVTLGWMCGKQGATSHSSSEAEIIALEAALRKEGLTALILWDVISEVLSDKLPATVRSPSSPPATSHLTNKAQDVGAMSHNMILKFLTNYDCVPCTLPLSSGLGKLLLMEDNDSVIKMTIKGRSPAMRHVPRTHRIDLDWLFERIRVDPGVGIRYVGTRFQLGDILTKGMFTAELWRWLCALSNLVDPFPKLDPKVSLSN
jgi:hypothetical protein